MTIFATYNIKGGVGKTAAAVNLAYLSALEGAHTLVWDIDPQGAATFYFRIKPKVKGGGKQLIKGKKDLDSVIKGSDFDNLDLLPADFSYRNLDLLLENAKKPTHGLHKLLKPLTNSYDHIFLDCPPGISLVSENILYAAEVLLVPVIPTTLSLRTLEQLSEFVAGNKVNNVQILPFLSMIDRRKKLHLELAETLPRDYPAMLSSAIPYASDIERMGLMRQPLGSFTSSSNRSNNAYQALWQEVKARI